MAGRAESGANKGGGDRPVRNGPATEDEEEQRHCSYAMQLVNSLALPTVLQVAVELGVLEIIAKAECAGGSLLTSSEIASRIPGCRNPDAPHMLDRMLRLLVSHSVLTCSDDQDDGRHRYGLAPVAKYFIGDQDGASLGPLVSLVQDEVFLASWVHGMHAFDYPGKDPRFNEVFNKAMVGHTGIAMKKILEYYKGGFEQLKQLVDVGGGLGIALGLITSKYPHIKGINFDQPHVVRDAPSYPGVEHVGGNMFESVPEGEAILMKWILHDWSDDHCLKLLKNCHKALPENGKVIVVEVILPTEPDTRSETIANYEIDLLMMTQNPGGKERTRPEFLRLATGAGFSGIRFEAFAFNFWVMEFYK
ncbi:caffeic acid 3-O-methyltransferase-like isoform X2 [Diospyros lotus]|uniref:caffeic acid 3-O-methyltransferase-like isoform X2 n=1 Tax=Diospyros lotus TaxID=55363 RepID=UPI002250DCB0|nr:caffeic acid 3-O-methyltransferase-like isoform X2 [Diospyros lotus]